MRRNVYMFTVITLILTLFLASGCLDKSNDNTSFLDNKSSNNSVTNTYQPGQLNASVSAMAAVSGVISSSTSEISLAPLRTSGLDSTFTANIKWYDEDTRTTQTTDVSIDSVTGLFYFYNLPGGHKVFIVTIKRGNIPIFDFPVIGTDAGTTNGIKEYKHKITIDPSTNEGTVVLTEIAFYNDNQSLVKASSRRKAFLRRTLKNYNGYNTAHALDISKIKSSLSLAEVQENASLLYYYEYDYYFADIPTESDQNISATDIFEYYKENFLSKKLEFVNGAFKDSGYDSVFGNSTELAVLYDQMREKQYLPTFEAVTSIEYKLYNFSDTSETYFRVGDIPKIEFYFPGTTHQNFTLNVKVKDPYKEETTKTEYIKDNVSYTSNDARTNDFYYNQYSKKYYFYPTMNISSTAVESHGKVLKSGEYYVSFSILLPGGQKLDVNNMRFSAYGDTIDGKKAVYGTIAYSGTSTGEIYIQMYSNSTLSSQIYYQTSIPYAKEYTIENITGEVFYISAFKDVNGDKIYNSDDGEPFGIYETGTTDHIADPVYLYTSQSSINITLKDGILYRVVDDSMELTITPPGESSQTYYDVAKIEVKNSGDIYYQYYAKNFGLIKNGDSILLGSNSYKDGTHFPLKIGNYWKYSGGTEFTYTIVSHETKNNHQYYKMKRSPDNVYFWYRIEGNDVILGAVKYPYASSGDFVKDYKISEVAPVIGHTWAQYP